MGQRFYFVIFFLSFIQLLNEWINALSCLAQMQAGNLPARVSAMGITGDRGKPFAIHPLLEERNAALKAIN